MTERQFPPATLACGCRLEVTERPQQGLRVMVKSKAPSCRLALHVAGVPLYDHRAAMRPSTRLHQAMQPDYEDG
jgi:hypothetical protein